MNKDVEEIIKQKIKDAKSKSYRSFSNSFAEYMELKGEIKAYEYCLKLLEQKENEKED